MTIDELDALRNLEHAPGLDPIRARIAGSERHCVVSVADTGALLVLTDPQIAGEKELTSAAVELLWRFVAERIRQQVAEAPPAYLIESRAASAERARVTSELTEQHSIDLQGILNVLRSPDHATIDHAIDTASVALVRLRTRSDRVISMAEEDVQHAFARLQDDLRPIEASGRTVLQFVPPPPDGRALPGEVAHAARAVIRGTVLAMIEHADVSRVRIQWDCDGTNLLIDVRDNGTAALSADAVALRQIHARVAALNGTITVHGIPQWGNTMSARLPLDPPPRIRASSGAWDLTPREDEILSHLADGKRNRSIASELNISENTVKFHSASIYKKMGVSSRAEAAVLYSRMLSLSS